MKEITDRQTNHDDKQDGICHTAAVRASSGPSTNALKRWAISSNQPTELDGHTHVAIDDMNNSVISRMPALSLGNTELRGVKHGKGIPHDKENSGSRGTMVPQEHRNGVDDADSFRGLELDENKSVEL